VRDIAGRHPVAWRSLSVVAAAFAALLIAFSGRYGYHRDELYFLVIGDHPAWGYADQPPLIPLLAHAMEAVSGGSLVALRLPPALAGAAVTVVTGLTCRELGGRATSQLLASLCMAVASVNVAAGHLAGTTAFDLLGWTVVTWLLVRAIRDDGPGWLWVGLAAGITLEVKSLLVFLLFGVTVGLLAVGPRSVFRSRWPYLAALVAIALWLPNLIWQARHDWPQLELSQAIADGSSGTSDSPVEFLLLQLGLVSPLLVPVWVVGLWRLWRDPELAIWRCFGVAYPLLAVVFLLSGGKAYYLAGLYPILLAAGTPQVFDWVAQHGWRPFLRGALLFSGIAAVYLFLPLTPPDELDGSPVQAVNYDAGEQVGWPELAGTVQTAYDDLSPGEQARTVVLTGNYGEAGAIAKYAPGVPVYSGHNSMWDLGPPPAGTDQVITVGFSRPDLTWCTQVDTVAEIDNDAGVDNDEQGAPVMLCRGVTERWQTLWPDLRALG
jgi:hypothetical protein